MKKVFYFLIALVMTVAVFCTVPFKINVKAVFHHNPLKRTVVTATSCTNQESETAVCSIYRGITTDIGFIFSKDHDWSSTDSIKCKYCNIEDTVVEILDITCKTDVFIGDTATGLSYQLELKTEHHEEITITTTDVELEEKWDSSTAGEKTYTAKYKEIPCKVEITVKTPKIIVKLNNTRVYNDEFKCITRGGLQFTVTNNTDDEISCIVGNENLTVEIADNTFTVKPVKYFVMKPEDFEKYYVEFSFTRNGKPYTQKIYLNYAVTSVKVSGTTSYVQGQKISKKKKITFTETYIDGTSEKYYEYLTAAYLNSKVSTVGKKTYKSKYYGNSVPFTYYVKCKAPTVKATAGTKAVTVKWNKIDGATGYQVYRSTSKTGGYKLVKTLSGGSKVSFKNTGLKSKQTYYYKVVAVYKANKNCNSKDSNIVSCKTK